METYWVDRLSRAPRVTTMAPAFESLATGEAGRPNKRVPLDVNLLGNDKLALSFAATLDRLSGNFDEHYVASIPYSREEEARIGAAFYSYGRTIAQRENRPAKLYITSGADGPVPRALATRAPGMIETLTCSPNEANREEFFSRGAPPNAYFFLGPYYEVTPTELSRRGMPQFGEGFDVIEEDTTFQMYDPDRSAQIALVRRNLKQDGIMVLFEKLQQSSPSDYLLREQQKDKDFKALYFDQAQIQQKAETVLTHMENMQVTLESLTRSLKQHFKAAVITFNSGNFYNIAASDDPAKLTEFVAQMIPPAIPSEFSYTQLPKVLFSPPDFACDFRSARPQEE